LQRQSGCWFPGKPPRASRRISENSAEKPLSLALRKGQFRPPAGCPRRDAISARSKGTRPPASSPPVCVDGSAIDPMMARAGRSGTKDHPASCCLALRKFCPNLHGLISLRVLQAARPFLAEGRLRACLQSGSSPGALSSHYADNRYSAARLEPNPSVSESFP
jgi:hypothetical protein